MSDLKGIATDQPIQPSGRLSQTILLIPLILNDANKNWGSYVGHCHSRFQHFKMKLIARVFIKSNI